MSTADTIPLPAVLARRLTALGIAPAALLREAGLPAHLLDSGRAKVSTAGFFALWAALERLDSDPALGLKLSDGVTPDQLDIASTAAMHAPTFGEALAKLARYKRLVCPEDIELARQGEAVAVEFRWRLSAAAPPARLIDACFASVQALARIGTGQALRALRVDYARPEQHRAVFEAHFGCPVSFGAPVDRIHFAATALEQPFRTSNPDVLAMLLPGLEAALGDLAEPSFLDQVRALIRQQMQGQRPSVHAVARALALSPRSLQRRLGEAGTSYQRLLDEVRRQVARELLSSTALDSGEIAFLLGFEELNSFTRAFSAWEGASPLRWRQRAQIQ
jgi:AraC-like DNA-binding protein